MSPKDIVLVGNLRREVHPHHARAADVLLFGTLQHQEETWGPEPLLRLFMRRGSSGKMFVDERYLPYVPQLKAIPTFRRLVAAEMVALASGPVGTSALELVREGAHAYLEQLGRFDERRLMLRQAKDVFSSFQQNWHGKDIGEAASTARAALLAMGATPYAERSFLRMEERDGVLISRELDEKLRLNGLYGIRQATEVRVRPLRSKMGEYFGELWVAIQTLHYTEWDDVLVSFKLREALDGLEISSAEDITRRSCTTLAEKLGRELWGELSHALQVRGCAFVFKGTVT